MKKLLLIPALLGSMAMANDYKYEITPVIGYNIAEGNLNLKNDLISGVELQFNDVDSVIKPEISLLHSNSVKSKDLTPSDKTDITRIAINGVYQYGDINGIIPFAKAGIGYETIDDHFAENTDGLFLNAGAGVKFPLAEAIALKLETVYSLKYNEHTSGGAMGDSNLVVLAGLNFAFGKKAQPEPEPTPAPAPTPEPAPLDGDDDNDGVLNSIDKCPTSPANAVVNDEGCPIIVNLHINFENDSYAVDAMSNDNIKAFADFLNMYPNYSATIVGHTDSKASEKYNQKLSENRANAVKKMIIGYGVSDDRIKASGMGETSPTADNSTKTGRAENRRIEAELIRN